MGFFKNLFKKPEPPEPEIEYENKLSELIVNEFSLMFIPVFNIFDKAKYHKVKYPYYSAAHYHCYEKPYEKEDFDTAYIKKCVKDSHCAIIEIEEAGSLVFANHHRDDLYHVLQRYYRDRICYVFKGNDTGGYFKKLKDGKISRKIASHLVMEGIGNNPETRGIPCEFEIERGKVFKVDPKAVYMRDAMPDFGKEEVRQLFDYYVGFDNITNDKIKSIYMYKLIVPAEERWPGKE